MTSPFLTILTWRDRRASSVDVQRLVSSSLRRHASHTGLVLRFRVRGELTRTRRHGAVDDALLQFVEDGAVLLRDERHRHTVLARATCSANPVRVLCKNQSQFK